MNRQRYKLLIAYRGTRYHGWQAQAAMEESQHDFSEAMDRQEEQASSASWEKVAETGPETETETGPGLTGDLLERGTSASGPVKTVQGELLRAVSSVVRHPVKLIGSSRTDAGVHAKGQVAHFDTDRTQIPPESLRQAVNARLPDDIVVNGIAPVPDNFDAISWTRSKRYQYAIWNAPDRTPLISDLLWHRWQKLDREAMAAAARVFVGTHDFTSFARPGHGRNSTVRTVVSCELRCRARLLVIGVEGTGFLWHMVRIMVGTLVEVGLGRHTPEQIKSMLEARDRAAAGATAPAHGLYLQWISLADHGPGTGGAASGRPVGAASQEPAEVPDPADGENES
jgi:tRNA pseudouridine38-40 synthase